MKSSNDDQAPSGDLIFFAKNQLLSADDVKRAIKRMAHEIIERNQSVENVSLIALQTGGKALGEKLREVLNEISGETVPFGLLDVSFYRDDLAIKPAPTPTQTVIDHDLTNRTVVLVDDVLFTGRTIRAALNALSQWGRPKAIQLCVLVDRGHRELPIRPDFVGKNLPTSLDEAIVATTDGVWIGTKGEK